MSSLQTVYQGDIQINKPIRELKISVVIPVYNLEGKICDTIRCVSDVLEDLTGNYEIIVVDDGSTDNTPKKLGELEMPKLKIVRNRRNIGKGFAVKRGIQCATGDYIIMMDADMEIPPKLIKRYVRILGRYDIIIGSKRHPKSVFKAPIMRKILSLIFHWMVRVLTGVSVSDTQTGLKAFRADVAKLIMRVILVKRYAFDVEVLAVAKLLNLRIAEEPVEVEISRGFPLKSIMYMLIDLLGIAYRLRILRWYQNNISKLNIEYRPIIPL